MNILTNANFLIYAATHYDNPNCRSTEEFNEDLRRIKYVKKLTTRYVESGDLKERLILNHLIVLNNVFAPMILCRMLYLKMEEYQKYLKPFLVYMNIYQDRLYDVKKKGIIDLSLIPMDETIIEALRKL